ncbi:MAG: hypothetical protein AB2L12_12065 [Smithellaceae bacterium]
MKITNRQAQFSLYITFSASAENISISEIGSIAGGYAPMLFGADSISASLLGSTIGGLLGIWGAYKLSG